MTIGVLEPYGSTTINRLKLPSLTCYNTLLHMEVTRLCERFTECDPTLNPTLGISIDCDLPFAILCPWIKVTNQIEISQNSGIQRNNSAVLTTKLQIVNLAPNPHRSESKLLDSDSYAKPRQLKVEPLRSWLYKLEHSQTQPQLKSFQNSDSKSVDHKAANCKSCKSRI